MIRQSSETLAASPCSSLGTDVSDYAPNPFCTRFIRPDAITFCFDFYEDEQQDAQSLMDRIRGNRRSLIVGPHGTGKSTLLRFIINQLSADYRSIATVQLQSGGADNEKRMADAFQRLDSQMKSSGSTCSHQAMRLLVVDGIEQLNRRQRFNLFLKTLKSDLCILATSHAPMWEFREVFRTSISSQLIYKLTLDRVCNCDETTRRLVIHRLESQDLESVTNLRDLWFDLYDLIADHQQSTEEM